MNLPTVDASAARLKRSGWSMGDVGTSAGWLVTGTNGENAIEARGSTQAEAWHQACLQAEAVGMLSRERWPCPKRSPGSRAQNVVPPLPMWTTLIEDALLEIRPPARFRINE